MTRPPPLTMASSFTIADLSHQMSDCSIKHNQGCSPVTRRQSTPSSEPSSPSTIASNSSFSATTPNTPPMTPLPQEQQGCFPPSRTYHSTNIRAQRQRAVRNQCTAAHQEEIAALVSRMVSNGEQCSVCSPSRPPSPELTVVSSQQSTSPQRISLARQDTDYSDGSVSPFSRAGYAEDADEQMDDADHANSIYDRDESTTAFAGDGEFGLKQGLGEWQFSWGGRTKMGEGSAAERKCCITKDTRSRKQQLRRRQ